MGDIGFAVNDISKFLRRRTEEYIRKLEYEARLWIEEAAFLQAALRGDFTDAYLTQVCMDDDPLLLFVGDRVMTKYCDEVTIERFDFEKRHIYFEEWNDRSVDTDRFLEDHRISHVIVGGERRMAALKSLIFSLPPERPDDEIHD
jgi:hypothetical protein